MLRAIACTSLVALCGVASGCVRQTAVQSDSNGSLIQSERVVLRSPHFDEPVRGWGGLSCPAAPAHFFGTASPDEISDSVQLSVNVGRYRGRDVEPYRFGEGLPGALVSVVPNAPGLNLADSFPKNPPYGKPANSAGVAEFQLPGGLYWIHVAQIGRRHGGALVQLKGGTKAVVNVELDVQALCEDH